MTSNLTNRPTLQVGIGDSILGRFAVAAQGGRVVAIIFGSDEATLLEDLRRRLPAASLTTEQDIADLVETVAGLIARPATTADLALDPVGTKFQKSVWTALRRLPAGATASYAEIAAAIGAPRAVRAVAGACAANPIAVAIPCHRVRPKSGGIGGYRWGAERKAALLRAEAAL